MLKKGGPVQVHLHDDSSTVWTKVEIERISLPASAIGIKSRHLRLIAQFACRHGERETIELVDQRGDEHVVTKAEFLRDPVLPPQSS